MSIYYRIVSHNILIMGQTYYLKDELKSLGARYNKAAKVWFLSLNENNLEYVKGLCKKYGGQELISFKSVYEDLNIPCISDKAEEDMILNENKEELNVNFENNTLAQNISKLDTNNFLAQEYTISQLMNLIEKGIKVQFPSAIWVIGEVQNPSFKNYVVFFDLAEVKDSHSQSTIAVKAKIWETNLKKISKKLLNQNITNIIQEGLKIRVLCEVELYKERAQISLNVLDVDLEFSLGALALAKEKLRKVLQQKGLYDKNKHKQLPIFPFNIGLISAQGSRAKSDFLDQLRLYKFCGTVFFVHAQMQGNETPDNVVNAIKLLEKANVDLIVITRGGGSKADLSWFDSEKIAYAIAQCEIPIISAIGHHEDTCIAEEVSFRREKTPTAAADFIINVFNQTKEYIRNYELKLYELLNLRFNTIDYQIGELKQKLISLSITAIFQVNQFIRDLAFRLNKKFDEYLVKRYTEIVQLQNNVNVVVKEFLTHKDTELVILTQRLSSLDPSVLLEKGWTRLFANFKVIKSIKDVKLNDQVKARLKDGIINFVVTNIEERHKHE